MTFTASQAQSTFDVTYTFDLHDACLLQTIVIDSTILTGFDTLYKIYTGNSAYDFTIDPAKVNYTPNTPGEECFPAPLITIEN